MKQLFCLHRKEYVAATPEELVRQRLLAEMRDLLGYPTGAIVVEKALLQLPHLSCSSNKLPDRRVDILIYSNREREGLLPLLLVECKAVALKPAALQQVAGYNHYIGAPFIAVANGTARFCGWREQEGKKWRFVDFIPPYSQLRDNIPH